MKGSAVIMKDKSRPLKKIPVLMNDEEAEDFVANADLTEYDLSEFKPFQFEFQKKEARVNMRIPVSLLEAVKIEAQRRGMPYQRFIRETIERAVSPARKKAS
jgi:predicted DNA binding CopG/RHH family protein